MRTAAILPVKSFSMAKQRLGASVADQVRLALAHAMLSDVLSALRLSAGVERTVVVTREPRAAAAARAAGAALVADEGERGQSAAVALGVDWALAEGFERVLCVPGDCPWVDPAELDGLLEGAAGARGVVVLPDRHGTGTNGLLLSPPDAIAPAFGPGSCERHVALARAAGVSCRVHPLPSLSLDIDTGADLDALRGALAGGAGRAPSTRSVLGAPGAAETPRPAGEDALDGAGTLASPL